MKTELDDALTELENQGLTIRSHDREKKTWHIADGGLYSGYVATAEELIELGRRKKLNMRSIINLE